MISVKPVEAFTDNYIWFIENNANHHVAIVDPGDEQPVLAAIAQRKLIPAAILCTHHHWDHTDGIAGLLERYDIPVYGPANESVATLTQRLRGGDQIKLPTLELSFSILDIPGHTRGHIAYYGHNRLFCGDTLFSAGCGRLFEGTAEQMHLSLATLGQLPASTEIYCGHEYTLSNLQFAETVEPSNHYIKEYITQCNRQRANNLPTLPSTLATEYQINPFLRTTEPTVKNAVEKQQKKSCNSEIEVFAALRRWKDNYKG